MYTISRPIEGISLNGDEYLLDDNGNPRVFSDMIEVDNFLDEYGLEYDDITIHELGQHENETNGCGHGSDEEHSCPFKEAINNDYETMCTCCSDCQHECAMDV